MNSGEEQLTGDLAAEVAEERGGPFVKTTGGTEFADGTTSRTFPKPRANRSQLRNPGAHSAARRRW